MLLIPYKELLKLPIRLLKLGNLALFVGCVWHFSYTTKNSRNSFSFLVFADGSVSYVYEYTFDFEAIENTYYHE